VQLVEPTTTTTTTEDTGTSVGRIVCADEIAVAQRGSYKSWDEYCYVHTC